MVKEIKIDLGQKPGEATTPIRILNYKTKEELEELGIQYRTKKILEVKKVLTREILLYNWRKNVTT